jgi:hypothetical protein
MPGLSSPIPTIRRTFALPAIGAEDGAGDGAAGTAGFAEISCELGGSGDPDGALDDAVPDTALDAKDAPAVDCGSVAPLPEIAAGTGTGTRLAPELPISWTAASPAAGAGSITGRASRRAAGRDAGPRLSDCSLRTRPEVAFIAITTTPTAAHRPRISRVVARRVTFM